MKNRLLTLASASAALILAGCSSTPVTPPEVTDKNAAGSTEAVAEPTLVKIEPVYKPFPIETLYSLLVAEIAGSREQYDIALGNYAQEAARTRDPGIAARATRIARLLDAREYALEIGKLWLEIEPNNAEALFVVASELAQAGQLLESFKYSEQLQRLGSTPIFDSIAARAGQITDTQRDQLLANYDRMLLEYPTDSKLLVGKAMLLQQQDQAEQALTIIQQALASDDEDVQAAVLEARLLYQLGRGEQALDRLIALLQRQPDNQRLRLQYARLLASIDITEAQEQFELLVEQSPNDPDLLFSLGLVAFEKGDLDTAKATFEQLIQLGSRTDSAHYYLGKIAEADKDPVLAVKHYLSVQQGADFLPSIGRATDILISNNQLEQARVLMDKMRAAFPNETTRFYLLEAQTLARYQHLTEAEDILNQGLTLHPNDTDLLYTRAMVYQQRDMIDLSETDLRTIIKYQPNNASALNALGYSLADQSDRIDEAYQLIKQALNISPNDPAIIDSMGWVQYRMGNYEEALLRLRQALKAFPDDEIAAHLGEVLWVSGEHEQAVDIWRQGLQLNPNSRHINSTMERLGAGKGEELSAE
ncbi:tetratricopeptide repeat protein [Aurantivibrio plasticivorans]